MPKTPTTDVKKSSGKKRRAKSANQKDIIDLQERLYRAELLLGLSQKIASLNSLDDILNILVEITTRELLAERGSILLNDETTGELYSRVAQIY